jgi:hypothetical protein
MARYARATRKVGKVGRKLSRIISTRGSIFGRPKSDAPERTTFPRDSIASVNPLFDTARDASVRRKASIELQDKRGPVPPPPSHAPMPPPPPPPPSRSMLI